MCGTQAESSHLAWQSSFSVAAIVGIKSSWVVVLSVPCSITISIAMPIVWSGVSIIHVSGLDGLWGLDRQWGLDGQRGLDRQWGLDRKWGLDRQWGLWLRGV